MQEIIEFVTKYYPLILTVVTAVAGLFMMLFGLGIFRRFYSILCAILGLAFGLVLHAAFPRDEMYMVAALICIACGVIGYENYKLALVLATGLSAFEACAVFVLRRVYEDITLALESARVTFTEAPDRASLLRLWYMRLKYEGNLKEAASIVFSKEDVYDVHLVLNDFENVLGTLQTGLGISLMVGVFAGLLSLILTDYIMILTSTALGSVMLVGVIDETNFLRQLQYNYKLAIFFVAGVVFQVARYYKSIEAHRQKKKRRGLYEKKR
ncbi:MAG: hypothetical protein K6B44_05395 [Lachnospiraceae bacterium]|nr:hypothetical protein [Lachnospiraceae bacterium]